jgi:peptide-methionine (R)-S-oxide reductase
MPTDPALEPNVDPNDLTDAQWREVLDHEEHAILRHASTERPGTGRYLNEDTPGAYHCAGCAQKLYDAQHKFHSGCGWPSFFQEVEPNALAIHRDTDFGMTRTEMRCARCDGHLGHIFDDAPQTPTGKRHCVNGNALIFVPQGADATEVLRAHRARPGR